MKVPTFSESAIIGLLAVAFTARPVDAGGAPLKRQSGAAGIDVSSFQGEVDWSSVVANGVSWAYIKATEGTTYTNPYFSDQYIGATDAGLIRGSYHFAHPNDGPGADQANFFLENGGGWSGDGITLPGALDIEYNPSGSECYGLSASAMVSWIADFSNTYQAATGVYPTIYSTTDWWTTCTGNSAAFGSTNPLWIARYASSPGTLPAGWATWTFWQYADSGVNPGDQDVFNGDTSSLQAFAFNP